MEFIEYCMKVKTTMVVIVLVVHPCEGLAGWELWLAATAQHHESTLSPTWEKIKIQNLKYGFIECV